jgi:hypothetical protein
MYVLYHPLLWIFVVVIQFLQSYGCPLINYAVTLKHTKIRYQHINPHSVWHLNSHYFQFTWKLYHSYAVNFKANIDELDLIIMVIIEQWARM